MLIKATDLVAPEVFSASAPIPNPNGNPGVAASFSNPDGTHVVGDTILILSDPAAASKALDAAKGTLGSNVTGGTPAPIAVGTGGTSVTGTSPDGTKSVTVVLFTEGGRPHVTQLADLAQLVRQEPEIGFTIAVLGWPLDLGSEAFAHWRRDLAALARCPNTRLSVSATECIFGMAWTPAQLRPWLLTAIDLFGPARTMLGSHLPICKLSHGFAPLYATYRDLLAGFSADEQDLMFRGVAAEWFRVG